MLNLVAIYIYVYVCMYTGVCSCEFMSWVTCYSVSDSLERSGPLQETRTRCGFVLVWTRYTGNLKTDLWDEP